MSKTIARKNRERRRRRRIRHDLTIENAAAIRTREENQEEADASTESKGYVDDLINGMEANVQKQTSEPRVCVTG